MTSRSAPDGPRSPSAQLVSVPVTNARTLRPRVPPPCGRRGAASSGQPHASASPSRATAPWRSACSRRPRPWRSDPAKVPWALAPGRARHGSGSGVAGAAPETLAPERTGVAAGAGPGADRCAEIEHGLVELPGLTRRDEAVAEARRGGGAERRSGDAAGQHPHARWCRRPPRRRRRRTTGRPAPCRHRRRAARRSAASSCGTAPAVLGHDDRHRRPVQVAGAAVVARAPTRPRTTAADRPAAHAAGVGKRREEALVVRARPGPPGSAGASPR